jgi:benzoylformate decarboxylase
MYTIQALWSAARYRIDVVWVILNNTSYRILKQRLHNMRGLAEQADSYVGMELTDPTIDFVGLARSLGVKAERAKSVHEATDLLGQALRHGGATLIDVDMDRAFKPV